MREMLESFRLPGEAQQIERITSTFAEIFFASGPGESNPTRVDAFSLTQFDIYAEGINSQDAVFVLAFAVIMLNTDLHSPNIRVSGITHIYFSDKAGTDPLLTIC
jgi:brefeldin A-resistance guanine nucleotide exchange factor 1